MNVYNINVVSHIQNSTSQPSYLRDLISVQPPRNTRSSSVITVARPPTRSSLKITSHSFRYAAPYLLNRLPDSFRKPLDTEPSRHSPHSTHLSSSSMSLLSLSITPSLFRFSLKTFFTNFSTSVILPSPPD